MCTLQGEVSYHSKRVRESALLFDFGRIPQWNCPIAGKKQVRRSEETYPDIDVVS